MEKSFTFLKGKRRKKSESIFEILGDLDELNAALGLAKAFANKNLGRQILQLQDTLIEIGSFLAGFKKINLASQTAFLEQKINQIKQPSLKTFVRPGRNKTSAFLHLSRVICRRLERKIIKLKRKDLKSLIDYLNLLSNFLFWLAQRKEKN